MSLINGTNELLSSFEFLYVSERPIIGYINLYFIPVWYLLGIPGNILSIIVWFKMSRHHPSAIFYLYLCINDVIFLILHVIFSIQYFWERNVLNTVFICKTFSFLFMMTQHNNIFIILLNSIERYLQINHPFLFTVSSNPILKLLNKRIVRNMVMCNVACILAAALQSPQFTFWVIKNQFCVVNVSSYLNSVYIHSWISETITFIIFPIIISMVNVCLIRQIKLLNSKYNQVFSKRKTLISLFRKTNIQLKNTEKMSFDQTNNNNKSVGRISNDRNYKMDKTINKKNESNRRVIIMLVFLNIFTILATFPATLMYLISNNFAFKEISISLHDLRKNKMWNRHLNFQTAYAFVRFVSISNFACNFFIFYWNSSKFKQYFFWSN
ncbi:hypothetical protein A3Q56_01782 [Intoshia linei]|uniref:G-protein coupled receptors family 1 profile domain-containing protein n=1 Tax=Intoshia linei TaxID=1819745 RepID=A0A177B885_9BILA|nr:hypothetical protein A3Q56_01782 [Intoshia linei]